MNNYEEYLIEYDNDTHMVYISGRDKNNFWFDIENYDDVSSSLVDFAEGYAQNLRNMGKRVDIVDISEYMY